MAIAASGNRKHLGLKTIYEHDHDDVLWLSIGLPCTISRSPGILPSAPRVFEAAAEVWSTGFPHLADAPP